MRIPVMPGHSLATAETVQVYSVTRCSDHEEIGGVYIVLHCPETKVTMAIALNADKAEQIAEGLSSGAANARKSEPHGLDHPCHFIDPKVGN